MLDRALNLVHLATSKALRDVSDSVSKQVISADTNETKEYALLYGSFENVFSDLGDQVETLLTGTKFTFREDTGMKAYHQSYHHLFEQVLDDWIRSRQIVSTVVQKNLQKFASNQAKPRLAADPSSANGEFQSLSRRCIQYTFEICDNEKKLLDRIFHNGPFLASCTQNGAQYAEKLEQNCMSHITTLFTFLKPHLSTGTMSQICDLVSWVEATYLLDGYDEIDHGGRRYSTKEDTDEYLGHLAQFLLNEHFWDLQDSLFLAAAADLQSFKPSREDLTVKGATGNPGLGDKVTDPETLAGLGLTKAYPTVKMAVNLLVMYNDNKHERPLQRVSAVAFGIRTLLTYNTEREDGQCSL